MMSRYKGRNLPDGKIQILQDGKECAIVNSREDAKALIMKLEAPPVVPPEAPVQTTSIRALAENKEMAKQPFDPAGLMLFGLGIFVCFIGFMIAYSMASKRIEEPNDADENPVIMPIAGKDEIKIKQFDLEITLTDFKRHVSVEKDGRGETTLNYNINIKNGSETKVENFSVGNSRGDGAGVWVSFSDEFGNDVNTWAEETKTRFRHDVSSWRIRPGDLKTRAMYTEGAILKAKKLKGVLGFRFINVPFIVELDGVFEQQKK